jgi:hypothetical protein
MGIAMLILSPCLVIFPLVYIILRHAEEIYNHPSTASSRRWSNLSRWIFREYNEVASPAVLIYHLSSLPLHCHAAISFLSREPYASRYQQKLYAISLIPDL